jgi:uncharacterized membrane protein
MEKSGSNQTDDITKKEKISFFSRLWVISAYVWVFAFVPYFLQRRNEFVKFHTKQGIVLFVTELILIFLSCIPIIGQLISLVGSIFCAYLSIRAMVLGSRGQKWVLPLIGKYAERIKD